jgi:hypothetical protein
MIKNSTSWFDVDQHGFSQVLADRDLGRIIAELIANAWDEDVSHVNVLLEDAGRGLTRVVVEDDSPQGFVDLSHSYVMFAPSKKKDAPQKRGRFNLGEKVVLSRCVSAVISSTTGTVSFNADGTRSVSRVKREIGSRFEGIMRMGNDKRAEVIAGLQALIAPVRTSINGEDIRERKIVATAVVTLPSVIGDGDGNLRRTRAKTTINIYEPVFGREGGGTIHEMGVPIIAVGDRFDVDVLQKVPLTIDRENVTDAFLRALRTEVLNATAHMLSAGEAATSWVAEALPRADSAAVKAVVKARFGERAVTVDPRDPESRSTAEYNGYTIVHGGIFSPDAWDAIKRADAIASSSSIFPTYGEKVPGTQIPRSDWTSGMVFVASLSQRLARKLIQRSIKVTFLESIATVAADYGGAHIRFNVSRLGRDFFTIGRLAEVIGLLIHEFAHEIESDHRSYRYHDTLTKFAGEVAVLALSEPAFFSENYSE